MGQPLKVQAAIKILREQREGTSIPVVVPLSRRDRPVVSLQAAVAVDHNDNECE